MSVIPDRPWSWLLGGPSGALGNQALAEVVVMTEKVLGWNTQRP